MYTNSNFELRLQINTVAFFLFSCFSLCVMGSEMRFITFNGDKNIYALSGTGRLDTIICNVFVADKQKWLFEPSYIKKLCNVDYWNQEAIKCESVLENRFFLLNKVKPPDAFPNNQSSYLIDIATAQLPITILPENESLLGIFPIDYDVESIRFKCTILGNNQIQFFLSGKFDRNKFDGNIWPLKGDNDKYGSAFSIYYLSDNKLEESVRIEYEKGCKNNQEKIPSLQALCGKKIEIHHKVLGLKRNHIISSAFSKTFKTQINELIYRGIFQAFPEEFYYHSFQDETGRFYITKSVCDIGYLWSKKRDMYYKIKCPPNAIADPLLFIYDTDEKKVYNYSSFLNTPIEKNGGEHCLEKRNIKQTILSKNGEFLCLVFQDGTLKIINRTNDQLVAQYTGVSMLWANDNVDWEGIIETDPEYVKQNKITRYFVARAITTMLDTTFIVPKFPKYLEKERDFNKYIILSPLGQAGIINFYKTIKKIFYFQYKNYYGHSPDDQLAQHYALTACDAKTNREDVFTRAVDHCSNQNNILCVVTECVAKSQKGYDDWFTELTASKFFDIDKVPEKICYKADFIDLETKQTILTLDNIMTVRFSDPDTFVVAGIEDGYFFASLYYCCSVGNRIELIPNKTILASDVNTCQIGDYAEFVFIEKSNGTSFTWNKEMLIELKERVINKKLELLRLIAQSQLLITAQEEANDRWFQRWKITQRQRKTQRNAYRALKTWGFLCLGILFWHWYKKC